MSLDPTPPSTPQVTLAGDIKVALRRKGLTLTRAAAVIGVPGATLRTWIDRNRFPEYGIERICKLLDWEEPDEVARKYKLTNGWSKERKVVLPDDQSLLMTALQAEDAICARTNEQLTEDRVRGLCRCFMAMRENDLFVLASLSVMPRAFEKQNWGPMATAIAEGVEQGGTYLYLFPRQDQVDVFVNDPWNFPKMIDAKDFKEKFAEFQHNVARYLQRRGVPAGEVDEIVKQRIVMLEYGKTPFMSPGFAIGMFQTVDDEKAIARRMIVRVPTDFSGVLYLPKEKDDVFTWRFMRFVSWAIEGKPAASNDKAVKRIREIIGSEFLPM